MGKGGENSVQANEASSANKVKKISLEELARHRTPNDAWVSYKGKVYDVSNWETHPGKAHTSIVIMFNLKLI
jgi:cytochrome b involved in lipid metabolism